MMIIMMAMIMMIMIMIVVTKVKDDCGEDLFHPGDIVRMLVGESGRTSFLTKTFLSRNLFSQKIVNLFLTPVGALKILVGWSLTHADFLLGRGVGRGKRSDPFIARI